MIIAKIKHVNSLNQPMDVSVALVDIMQNFILSMRLIYMYMLEIWKYIENDINFVNIIKKYF